MAPLDAGRAPARDADQAPYETGGYKWYVAIVLCAAHTISIIDRFAMILVTEPLRAAMSLTDTQLGLLQGTGFALLYCGFALPLGCIADATNRRNLIFAGLSFWSLATMAAAFTSSFETLFLTRVMVGLGEACLIPAGMSLLATYFAPSNLARGSAVFGTGANFGYGAAFIGGGALLATFTAAGGLSLPGVGLLAPWQGIFLCAGFAALPVLAMLIWLREPPRAVDTDAAGLVGQLAGMRRGIGYILTNLRAYLPFLVVAAATSATGYALNSWASSLWVRLHGLTPADAGKLIGLIGIIIGPLGTLSGGIVLDKLRSRGVVAAPMVIMAGGAIVCVAVVAGFVMASAMAPAAVCFALFMFESFFVLPSVYAGMQMLTPDSRRGVAASFNMMTYTLVGLGLGPTAVGLVSDAISGPKSLGLAVFVVELAMAAVIVPVALLSRRAFQQRMERI